MTNDLTDYPSRELIEELRERGEETNDISDFCDDDLKNELEERGFIVFDDKHNQHDKYSLYDLFELKRLNDPKFDNAFADYIYYSIGKIL